MFQMGSDANCFEYGEHILLSCLGMGKFLHTIRGHIVRGNCEILPIHEMSWLDGKNFISPASYNLQDAWLFICSLSVDFGSCIQYLLECYQKVCRGICQTSQHAASKSFLISSYLLWVCVRQIQFSVVRNSSMEITNKFYVFVSYVNCIHSKRSSSSVRRL